MPTGGISIHAVDVSRAKKAKGLRIAVYRLHDSEREPIAKGVVGADGQFDHPIVAGEGVGRGCYEVEFALADYYRGEGLSLPNPPFIDVLVYRFGIDTPEQHYHLPLKMTPWGFSLFRGN